LNEPVTGFGYPIVDACLPVEDSLMPGAPRDYRNGIHEGVDFYDVDNCATIGMDTEVLAAKAGVVIRADLDYQDITADDVNELQQRAVENGSSEDIEDAFRGRQVWLQHDDGTVTRYAHLNAIVEGLDVGATVVAGEVIAFVGDSGTPESVSSPGSEAHLHFEIRLGASYLGQGLMPDDVRELYLAAFSE
jgi:murein DD-endopeptidase MepM/ murein hydrolase activator NlpD